MLKINHNFQGHLWCGIAALGAAVGIPTTQARDLFKSVSMRRYIKAVSYAEMAAALARLGKKPIRTYYPRDYRECPMLSTWLEQSYRETGEVNVICITGHWITVKDDMWIDSMAGTERHVSDCPYLRSRVRHVVTFKGDAS